MLVIMVVEGVYYVAIIMVLFKCYSLIFSSLVCNYFWTPSNNDLVYLQKSDICNVDHT